jgi:hypothetical protein
MGYKLCGCRDTNFGKQIARLGVVRNAQNASIRPGDEKVSLCWHNSDPLEERDAFDIPLSDANLPDGEQSEATRMITWLRGWRQSVVPGLSRRIPAGNGLARIKSVTK